MGKRRSKSPVRRSAAATRDAFVAAYFAHGCNWRAAAREISPKATERQIDVLVSRMRADSSVATRIERRAKELAAPLEMTAKEAVERLVKIVRADRLELFDDRMRLRPKSEIPEGLRMMIDGIEPGEYGVKVKMPRSLEALDMLYKHLGLYKKDNEQRAVDPEEVAARMRAHMAKIEETTGGKKKS